MKKLWSKKKPRTRDVERLLQKTQMAVHELDKIPEGTNKRADELRPQLMNKMFEMRNRISLFEKLKKHGPHIWCSSMILYLNSEMSLDKNANAISLIRPPICELVYDDEEMI